MVIPTVGVISRAVDFQYRSRVNGLVSSGIAYGQFAAGSIAPWLVLDAGWRSVWLILGVASIIVAIAGFAALKAFAPAAFSNQIEHSSKSTQQTKTNVSIFNRTNMIIWSLLRAPRMTRLPKPTTNNMKTTPANSRYE